LKCLRKLVKHGYVAARKITLHENEDRNFEIIIWKFYKYWN